MTKIYFTIVTILLCKFGLSAQPQDPADSLQTVFNQAKTDTARLSILFKDNPYKYMGKPQQMLALYQRGYVLAQQQNDQARVFKAHFYTALVYIYNLQDEVTGFQYLQKALTVAEARNDYFDLHRVYYAMSIVQDHQNNHVEMYKYLYKGIEAAEKTKNPDVGAFQSLGENLYNEKRLDECLTINKRLLALLERSNSSIEKKLQAYTAIADVLKLLPNRKQEFVYYREKAERLFDSLSVSKTPHIDLIPVGLIYYKFNRLEKAKDIFKQILAEKLDSNTNLNNQAIAHGLLSDIYELQGNYPLSTAHLKKHYSIELAATKKRLADEAGKKIIKAESERDLLLKQQEIDKQKWFAISGFCMALVLLIGCLIVYRFYKREQQIKQELALLNATKDRLFALLSHDLLSPVAILKNFIMLVDFGAMNQQEFAATTNDIRRDVNNLYNMLETVLHWSVTQMREIKPKFEQVNIAEVIGEQVSLLEPIAKSKGIVISQHIPSDLVIDIDKNHLALVIRNLLQNALKFTNVNGTIEFNAKTISNTQIAVTPGRDGAQGDKSGYAIEIKDNGVGMSADVLDKLFKTNENTNRKGTHQEAGTGLGLILTKELVELNKGQISAQSEVGKGTTFSLTF
ncbi:MAG: hypothetical protein JNL70_23370 [Saprospiraceae bacterium]|nr:hypothetical protein [Saprospiraceae bacterium]